MARTQAHQPVDKLVRVGKFGFNIIDDIYGRPKKSGGRAPPAHHQYSVYRPQVMTVLLEPIMDSNKAAQFYGGKAVVDHRITKPVHRSYY